MNRLDDPPWSPGSAPLDIERACAELAAARSPVCLAGRGAVWSGATEVLLNLCARLPKLRVASTPGAKGVFPERHPQALGVWGFSGHSAALAAVAESDTLLVVGSRLLEQSSGHWHSRLRGPGLIRVDVDATRAASSSETTLALQGDARLVLSAIQRGLAGRTEVPIQSHAGGDESAIARFEGAGDCDCFVRPQGLFGVLSRIAAEVPICADAGNAMCWAIEWLERNRPREFQVSLDWGSMGFALPAAIGISLARKGQPAIAVTGDGSMAMSGGDLHTAVELELPIVVVVLNDGGAGMVRAGSEAWFGPDAIPNPDYRYRIGFSAYARGFGARAELVTGLESFELGLRAALSRATPTVLDVLVDPEQVPGAIAQRVRGLGASGEPAPHATRPGGGMC